MAHKILTIAWHIIRDGDVYRETGANGDPRSRQRIARRLARRLEKLGFSVSLSERQLLDIEPAAASHKPEKRGRPCLCRKRGIICIHSA